MNRLPTLVFKVSSVALIAVLTACASQSSAPAPPSQSVAWSSQTGGIRQVDSLFVEEPVSYAASWSELRLDPNEGVQSATISGTSYVRQCDCAPENRAVMFLFNGGPGASSSPLHFALGPASRDQQEGGPGFSANQYTVLDSTDLVFIDPVETGYSRANSEEGRERYLGVEGDVAAVNAFIHEWLAAHDRTASPVFLAGQSYGGFRLANLVSHLDDLEIRGLVMVSPMLEAGAGGMDLGHVFALPTMAATAWRFGKSALEARDEADAWEQGRAFAEGDYLLALQQGDALSDKRKEAVAETLSSMTGLPRSAVIDRDLRVNVQYFLETVLAGEGLLVSRLNTATTTQKPPSDLNTHRPPAANDPSLGLGRSNVIIANDIKNYLAEATGVVREDEYRSLNLDANFAWDWRGAQKTPAFYVNASQALSQYMSQQPDVRLLVFGGYRDLATPLLGSHYTLTHNGLPQPRVELVKMPGGHSPYDEPQLKQAFSTQVRDFIRSAGISSNQSTEIRNQ